jgi:hypothetical protein
MLLFIVVALGLYILYTKPSIVPGRRRPGAEHPVIATAMPGNPIATEIPDEPVTPRGPTGRGAITAEKPRAGSSRNAVIEGGQWWRRRKRR